MSTLCATSVLAAELPIEGVYGDELGCALLNLEPDAIDEPGGLLVRRDGIEGYEWGCAWVEVWPNPNIALSYGVQGMCSGEGVPFLEQYILELRFDDPTQMSVFAANGELRWEFNQCEAAQPAPGSKG